MSFVTTNSTKFILDGSIWHPIGASIFLNTVTSQNLVSYITQRLDDYVSYGFSSVRATNFFQSDGPYDEATWVRVDNVLHQASLRNLKVSIELDSYRGYIIDTLGVNPYKYDWTTFIEFLTSRVNTVNGIIYKNDPTLWHYGICSESHSFDFANTTVTDITNHMNTVSSLIKNRDSNHLVSSGGLNNIPGAESSIVNWKDIWSLSNIDFGNVHAYTNSDYKPFTQADFNTLSNYAANINKPWIVEEFGTRAKIGATERANFMRLSINRMISANVEGIYFYNYGYETQNTTFDIGPQFQTELANIKILKGFCNIPRNIVS